VKNLSSVEGGGSLFLFRRLGQLELVANKARWAEGGLGARFQALVRGSILLASQPPFLVVMWFTGRATLTWNRGTVEDYGIHKIANHRRHR